MSQVDKIDIGPIIRDHLRTLVTKPSNRLSWRDLLLMYAAPGAVGVVSSIAEWEVASTGNLIAAVSLFAALLFALLIRVLEDAAKLADRAASVGSSRRLVERANVLRSIGSNVAYATLVSILAAAVLVIADQWSTVTGTLPVVWSAVVLGVLSHVLLTFLMVLKRSYRLLRDQIDAAMTGDR